jgi:predicted molibdopterin-dependent oxidoreductase YjgC
MTERIEVRIDGRAVEVLAGISVSAALWNAGKAITRRSVGGAGRGPLCAMGICFECRVTIDRARHRRACMTIVAPGMEIATDE